MSKRSTATKLPSQVKAIGDAAESMAVKTGMKPEIGKPGPVDTASSKLVAINTNEPANKGSSAQEDWELRYKNFKKVSDTTVSGLRSDLAKSQESLIESQRLYQDLLKSSASSNVAASSENTVVENQPPSITRDSPEFQAYFKRLPEVLTNEYTEDYLFHQYIMQVSAAPAAPQGNSEEVSRLEAKIDNVAQVQQKSNQDLYEEELDTAFPNDEWIITTASESFATFALTTVSDVDHRSYGQILNEGNQNLDAPAVKWVLNEFKKQSNSTLDNGAASSANDLSSQLTPDGSGNGSGGDPVSQVNAQSETYTLTQVNQFFVDVATGTKYTAEEASSIEKSILAAQNAGKIIQG